MDSGSQAERWQHVTVVLLAGGAARRLGGRHKPGIVVRGQSLLDRVLAAWPVTVEAVVVGPEQPTARSVRWCRESPVGGGPVSAVAAAMPLVTTELVALLGADMPLIGPAVAPLVNGATTAVRDGRDGAWLVSPTGKQQPLGSCVRRSALDEALPTETDGQALFPILQTLSLDEVPVADEWLLDTDTDDDLARVAQLLDQLEGRSHD
jgi:molybdopterin-guanine dinucleotide biosynthesis protein A